MKKHHWDERVNSLISVPADTVIKFYVIIIIITIIIVIKRIIQSQNFPEIPQIFPAFRILGPKVQMYQGDDHMHQYEYLLIFEN